MSSTSKQTTRASTMNGIKKTKKTNGSSTEAKRTPKSASHDAHATKHAGGQFIDSGFFEDDDSVSYEYSGDRDFILFGDDSPSDEGYFFAEEDAVDIASTKACHGSTHRGTNSSLTDSSNNNVDDLGRRREEADSSNKADAMSYEEEVRPQHMYSTSPSTGMIFSTVDLWSMSFQRHESIAYRFEQLPNPSHVFQPLQQTWCEEVEIDLS